MKKRKEVKFKEDKEFEQSIIDLARVTRVMAGGKRMRFRACVAIGDKKGRVGMGLAKGEDVTLAINKAVSRARKNIISVPIVNDTIPYELRVKFKAAKILIKPAPKGSGVKAGGAMRIVLELAGISNVVGKILGTNNKVNNVKATIKAFQKLAPAGGRFASSQVKDVKPKRKAEKTIQTKEKKMPAEANNKKEEQKKSSK